jgi:hypothetical protein
MKRDVVDAVIAILAMAGMITLALAYLTKKSPAVKISFVDRSLFEQDLVHMIRSRLVPFVITGKLLPNRPEYVIYKLFSYSRSILGGLVGLGVAPPVIRYLGQIPESGSPCGISALQAPQSLQWIAWVSAGAVICMTVYVSQTALDRRATLADSCASEMRSVQARALQIMPQGEVQAKYQALSNEVATIVQRHVAERDWTYPNIVAPGIDEACDQMTDEILAIIAGRTAAGTV